MAPAPGETTEIQALLDLAAAGDETAYARLIERASERLLVLTRRMLRNYPQLRRWEQTDDVFQNAAIKLYRSLNNLKPESVRAFLGLATLEIRRSLIDLVRHHFGPEGAAGKHVSDVARREESGDAGLVKNIPDRGGEPDSLEAWAAFHEAIDALPGDEREVFQLLWYGGLGQQEVASVLGVSVPTVQRRWYRARHLLGSQLQQPPSQES